MGDPRTMWSNLPRRVTPVLLDLEMDNTWKGKLNKDIVDQLHDRGIRTGARKWLTSKQGDMVYNHAGNLMENVFIF